MTILGKCTDEVNLLITVYFVTIIYIGNTDLDVCLIGSSPGCQCENE